MFHTYVLYYIGHTNDIERRILEHNEISENSYTAKFRPWTLMVHLTFDIRSQAMAAEKYLKKKPRVFIKRLIDEIDLQEYVLDKYSSAG